jgi:glycosyltransferase involved in cell wall biosynthesis
LPTKNPKSGCPAPALSVIIPAYNEEKRLLRTLRSIRDYFASRQMDLRQVEMIVVDDGSNDGTVRVAEAFAPAMPLFRILANGRNRGKGYSVRHGMLEARGSIAIFTDADLSAPIEEAEKLLAAIRAGNDVAIGSRALDRSLIAVHQSSAREIAGIVYNAFVRLIVGLPFHDTQCGFKAFLREPSRIVFEQQRIERFGFDPEILYLARHHGLRASEVPVRWSHNAATKVHVFRDSLRMFGDLIYIRWNRLIGRYPKTEPSVGRADQRGSECTADSLTETRNEN